jgi:hypothetical protein
MLRLVAVAVGLNIVEALSSPSSSCSHPPLYTSVNAGVSTCKPHRSRYMDGIEVSGFGVCSTIAISKCFYKSKWVSKGSLNF